MQSKLHLLVASRSKAALEETAGKLSAQSHYKIDTRHIENGHADPLWGLSFVPDVIVLTLDATGHEDLAALTEGQAPGRPPMIVLAENGDAQTMRLAMQAGARDFLPGVTTAEDLVVSVERVASQLTRHDDEAASSLTVFVNAKGGSGATFMASNVAHISTEASQRSTALLSLDMQFDSLAQLFDAKLRHGLLQVLDSVDDLDAVALDAYMTQHESGLRMLAAEPENVVECHENKTEALGRLLEKMLAHYDHVVVDMPRRVDPYMVPVLKRATRIVLVVEQTLHHIRDARRMLQIFGAYGVTASQVLVVVNRFDKNSDIHMEDVKRALQGTEILAVPSDFKTVSESINLGVPMFAHARGSAVTKALVSLETHLGGKASDSGTGIFGKALTGILRKQAWQRV